MTVVAARVTVTTSPTPILTYNQGSGSFSLKNKTKTASIFLGGSDVTTATGFEWETTDGPPSFDLRVGEVLYGVVASTQQVVHVIGAGR